MKLKTAKRLFFPDFTFIFQLKTEINFDVLLIRVPIHKAFLARSCGCVKKSAKQQLYISLVIFILEDRVLCMDKNKPWDIA
jgi:hypothetical protein